MRLSSRISWLSEWFASSQLNTKCISKNAKASSPYFFAHYQAMLFSHFFFCVCVTHLQNMKRFAEAAVIRVKRMTENHGCAPLRREIMDERQISESRRRVLHKPRSVPWWKMPRTSLKLAHSRFHFSSHYIAWHYQQTCRLNLLKEPISLFHSEWWIEYGSLPH